MSSRLIIAANRGPYSFSVEHNGRIVVANDGGTTAADILRAPTLDGGTPGEITWISIAATAGDRAAAQQSDHGRVTAELPAGVAVHLITPSRRALHRYYNIICNPLLWFLHHRSWGFTHTPSIDHEAHTAWEQGIVVVSRLMAEAIAAEAAVSKNATPEVHVRGYHMHLVPGMVRQLLPAARIRYSPAVPWPSPADWMMLPRTWRSDVFGSVSAADEIELTSRQDLRCLRSGIGEFAGGGQLEHPNGKGSPQLSVTVPSGDSEAVVAMMKSRRAQSFVERFERDDRFTFVTAERAEPYRNIVRSIRAFGRMLESDNSLAAEARFLLLLAPPPPHLSQYRRYMGDIEHAVREVNSNHRSDAGDPVELIVESNYHMAIAAMATADALVAVPLADAACTTVLTTLAVNQHECRFVVSETSSISEANGDSFLLVSPTDVEGMADAMLQAIETPGE